jgi:phospholipid/cholesterol/gamma-HCH transport system permease protein
VIRAPIEVLGRTTDRFITELGGIARFAAAVVRTLVTPPLRVRPFLNELFKLGVLSLVIICVSGLAVGMVLGLQGYNTLVRFGSE